ncbi:alpha/beta hydrolase [Fibrobacter sp. UWH4]|uniref:alpha/beta hydrolase n=1 Tax=Fibrobacter sp. UWH4 TaxID=1896210 RepID=UPI000915E915|nr:alpha/beta hydrolase [Fibrobacter sp. UWH4]SHK32938.1 Acetyl esterase/lipase [Fibrobacter sp. UWH4]
MKKNALLLACLIAFAGAGERYKDRMFDVSVERDVVYASGVKHLKKLNTISLGLLTYAIMNDGMPVYLYENETDLTSVNLHMDIYKPKNDSEKKRPAVLVMHGGAFAAGSKNDYDQHSITYCDSLAARGYVAVAVEYRLGITAVVKDKALTVDSLDFSRTVYRGIQDVRAAVRYVRMNADKLGVDPGRVYLIGNSAGAILSLENIYMDKESEIPAAARSVPDLGGLDAYGVQGANAQANAVAALWGAVHDPKIIEDVKKPVLLVHGKADSTVVFKTARPLSNIAGVLENLMPAAAASIGALAFHVNTPTLYGSYVIDSVLTANGVEHDTYFVDGQPHEFYDDPAETKNVQNKVFNFLYAQTQKPAGPERIVLALARPSQLKMGEDNRSFYLTGGNERPYAVADLRGRIVKSGMVFAGESVDLMDLERGVYVLRVKGERPLRFGLTK